MAEKGFREGIDKQSLMKSMTKEDWSRIEEQKKFEMVKKGSFTERLVLYLDGIREIIRSKQLLIDKRIWNVRDIQNGIRRKKIQITSGTITEKLKDGITMTAEELNTQIMYEQWMVRGEVHSIASILGEIRGVVGHNDVAKKVVMSEDEFNSYADKVVMQLKEMGHELFS